MAKFRIKATVTMDLWKEIEAPTEEEARSIFYDGSFREIVDDADETDICDVDVDSIEKTSATYHVRAYDIDYDVSDEEDEKAIAQRPTDLELWLDDVNPDNLEDSIQDEIEYKTDLLVNGFRYVVIEEK